MKSGSRRGELAGSGIVALHQRLRFAVRVEGRWPAGSGMKSGSRRGELAGSGIVALHQRLRFAV
ncbi:hypothetical protein CK247_31375, partial [Klebsiella pneumoniae]